MAACRECNCKGIETKYLQAEIKTVNNTAWGSVGAKEQQAALLAVASAFEGKVEKGKITWPKDKTIKEVSPCKPRAGKPDDSCTCTPKTKQNDKAWSNFQDRDFQVDFPIGGKRFQADGKLNGRERKLKVYCAPRVDTEPIAHDNSFDPGLSLVLASGRAVPPAALRKISKILAEDAPKRGTRS